MKGLARWRLINNTPKSKFSHTSLNNAIVSNTSVFMHIWLVMSIVYTHKNGKLNLKVPQWYNIIQTSFLHFRSITTKIHYNGLLTIKTSHLKDINIKLKLGVRLPRAWVKFFFALSKARVFWAPEAL